MRFPKTLTCCCMLAVGTATLVVGQNNSDAQKKALDALRQYTVEQEGQKSKPLTAKPSQKSEDNAAAKELEQKARDAAREQQQQEPAKQQPAVKAAAVPVAANTQSSDDEKDRQAREALDALRRGDTEPQAQSLTATTSPGQPGNQDDAARSALEASYASTPDSTHSPTTATDDHKPEAASHEHMEHMEMAVMEKAKPVTRKEKLNDLLELYMDNTITPREYHDRRAIIIAGK